MIRGMLRETFWYSGDPDPDPDPDSDPQVASLSALCPACDFEHRFNVDLVGPGKWSADSPVWEFDGNYDSPTFSPSMLSNRDKVYEHHPVCHSFLRAGIWEYLGDCTHAMAGQNVPMIPPKADATFQRRHGWHLFPWTDDEGEPLVSS